MSPASADLPYHFECLRVTDRADVIDFGEVRHCLPVARRDCLAVKRDRHGPIASLALTKLIELAKAVIGAAVPPIYSGLVKGNGLGVVLGNPTEAEIIDQP